ncbi:WecB/TagA/CpsF family glycosyltransferase [Methylocapsa acidiphila]|uniref:WecB/TagA/CpsF family glycosyltransferase n=1 Tax=Methylocapsa acidiphila TaxID=133552 RepID=UPI0004023387|nr:WecB/TagA/CpsF family glycosyltransferase [Methylocapsa acidiphila]
MHIESIASSGGAPLSTAVNAEAWPHRANILGVGVSALNMGSALGTFDRWIASGARHYVCVADVHSIMQGQWRAGQRDILNKAGMVTPDGMPLVWLCRAEFGASVNRVYGPDLLMAVCEHSIGRGYKHFFYGGGEGVAEKLGEILQRSFPGLEVCGSYCPPFRPLSVEEEDEVAARINAADPHFIWVGLSTPKQEQWMARMRDRLNAPALIGIGAAFDFHSGAKPQAPLFVQRSGLEWLFRLVTEPRRLWPRYRKVIPGFIGRIILQKTGLVRFDLN